MVQKITSGVQVSVETYYQAHQSVPLKNEYIFAYGITIVNLTTMPIRLVSRHWYIFDSNGLRREVEGMGVVGKQPIIDPNDQFEYVSFVDLTSDMGKMHGTYMVENMFTKELFEVIIPEFTMIAFPKLN